MSVFYLLHCVWHCLNPQSMATWLQKAGLDSCYRNQVQSGSWSGNRIWWSGSWFCNSHSFSGSQCVNMLLTLQSVTGTMHAKGFRFPYMASFVMELPFSSYLVETRNCTHSVVGHGGPLAVLCGFQLNDHTRSVTLTTMPPWLMISISELVPGKCEVSTWSIWDTNEALTLF
jgi:hypothetical protein